MSRQVAALKYLPTVLHDVEKVFDAKLLRCAQMEKRCYGFFFMLTNIQLHEPGNFINPKGGNSVQAVSEEQGQQLQKAA